MFAGKLGLEPRLCGHRYAVRRPLVQNWHLWDLQHDRLMVAGLKLQLVPVASKCSEHEPRTFIRANNGRISPRTVIARPIFGLVALKFGQ